MAFVAEITLKQCAFRSVLMMLVLNLGGAGFSAIADERGTDRTSEQAVAEMAIEPEARDDHEQDALQVLALIEDSRNLRERMPEFIEESSQAIREHKGALPSAYALRLAKALAEASEVRKSLFEQALTHRGALYRVDAGLDDAERITQIVIAMSAAVTLYENNAAMRLAFKDSPVLRKKLNEGYPEFGIAPKYYDTSVMRAANQEYRRAMADAVKFVSDHRDVVEYQINHGSESVRALYAHIAQSEVLKEFKGASVFKEIIVLPVKLPAMTIGGVASLSGKGFNRLQFTASKVVGNTIGLVRWRDGKMKGKESLYETMHAHLQPGDILLEKTPFTLTDKSIPGHFGHAAIYVGTAEQLAAIQALDLPVVSKHLESIKAGRVVVEALRGGVQLDSLRDFMNVDDVAILRPKYLGEEDRRNAVALALGNLGKKYDFNFDVNTTETIVCSELVYIVYPQVDFVTKRVLTSFSITPDDIAKKAGTDESDPLELILFGHDGKVVFDQQHDAGGRDLYEKLVKGRVKKNSALVQSRNSFIDALHKSN